MWERTRPRLDLRLDSALDWLRESARPPPGVTLQSRDGELFTGFAVLDRSRVIVLLAFRERGPPPTSAAPPSPTTFNSPRGDQRHDGSSLSLWDHEHRHRFDDG